MGTPFINDGNRSVFEQYREAGVERVMLHLPFEDIDGVRRALDAYADEFLKAFPQ